MSYNEQTERKQRSALVGAIYFHRKYIIRAKVGQNVHGVTQVVISTMGEITKQQLSSFMDIVEEMNTTRQ